MPQRIVFKVVVFVNNSLHNDCPEYLSELIVPTRPTRSLRSSNSIKFNQWKVKTNYGSGAFSNIGPELWNTCHDDIKNSKSLTVLKKS